MSLRGGLWQSSGGYMLGVGDPLTAVSQPRDDGVRCASHQFVDWCQRHGQRWGCGG
ncbi:MAG: hypothetical protein NC218_07990 [Acetobacter sp.]|nr:hypothetical protein [Acetobacter sp.]